jgi:hypothetical protein
MELWVFPFFSSGRENRKDDARKPEVSAAREAAGPR